MRALFHRNESLSLWHSLRLDRSKGPNRVDISPSPHLPEDGNRSSFRTLCFLVSRIPDGGQSPKSQ
jgi:hypothetical protein